MRRGLFLKVRSLLSDIHEFVDEDDETDDVGVEVEVGLEWFDGGLNGKIGAKG